VFASSVGCLQFFFSSLSHSSRWTLEREDQIKGIEMIPFLLLALLATAAALQPAACSPLSNVTSASYPRGRVLALLPHASQRFTRYSRLLSSIEARGWEVVARSADDPKLRLREWDTWLWDKIVVIPEEKGKRRLMERERSVEEREEIDGHLKNRDRGFFFKTMPREKRSRTSRRRERVILRETCSSNDAAFLLSDLGTRRDAALPLCRPQRS